MKQNMKQETAWSILKSMDFKEHSLIFSIAAIIFAAPFIFGVLTTLSWSGNEVITAKVMAAIGLGFLVYMVSFVAVLGLFVAAFFSGVTPKRKSSSQ